MKASHGNTVLIFLLLFSVTSIQAQIYTWVDENGKKHFGDTVPPAYRGKTDKITVETSDPGRDEVERAKNRYKRFEAINNKEAEKRRTARHKTNASEKKTYASEYERKLAEYNESKKCFSKCRIKIEDKVVTRYVNGMPYTYTIPGGYNNSNCGHCKEVTRPVR